MRKKSLFLVLFAWIAVFTLQAKDEPALLVTASQGSSLRASDDPSLYINGNDATISIFITATGLNSASTIKIIAPSEFTLSKTTLPYDANNAEVVIGLKATKPVSEGELFVIVGGLVKKYNLIGHATPLVKKNIATDPIYPGGNDTGFEISDAEGFTPSDKGYTFEFSAKLNTVLSHFSPFVIKEDGEGFKGYIEWNGNYEDFGIHYQEIGWANHVFSNREDLDNGGLGVFYRDNEYHTYRYAVAPDKRVFVYRDGVYLDYFLLDSYPLPFSFAGQSSDSEMVENLLVNPNFEEEYELISEDPTSGIASLIRGWQIATPDRWNSYQKIQKQPFDKEHDFTNHALSIYQYEWGAKDPYNDAEIGQIVDVVPGETYTFSALAKGIPMSKEGNADYGKQMGSLKIQDIRAGGVVANTTTVPLTSSEWEEYSMDYTTSAACKQIRVLFSVARSSDRWSATSGMLVDDAKLTGPKPVNYSQKIGFTSRAADIQYFAYDVTGAYAPVVGIDIVAPTGIKNVTKDGLITTSVNSGLLYLNNAPASSEVVIYNASGTLLKKVNKYDGNGIPLPQKGFYVAVIKNRNGNQTVKVVY